MARADKYLTNPITGREARRLAALVKPLPWPSNYLSGYSGCLTMLPRDILVFRHRRAITHEDYVCPRFLLSISLKAGATVMIDGKPFLLAPGQGLLIFPDQAYRFECFDAQTILWLFVSFVIDDAKPLARLRETVATLPSAGYALLCTIAERYQEMLDQRRVSTTGVGPALAGLLEELVARAEPKIPGTLSHSEYASLLKRIVQLVDEHLDDSPTIAELAAMLCMSEGHLRRLYHQATGGSLGQHILFRRIHRAIQLLHSTEMRITEIGEATGFRSVYAFSRAFKHYTQRTPSDFRKDVRAGLDVRHDHTIRRSPRSVAEGKGED